MVYSITLTLSVEAENKDKAVEEFYNLIDNDFYEERLEIEELGD